MNSKKLWSIMLLLSLAISFLSCGDDEEHKPGPNGPEQEVGDNTGEISFTGGVETLYITGAEVVGYVNVSDAVLANTTFGIVYSTSAGTSIDNCDGCLSSTSIEGKKYNVIISGLEANTKYYYRSYARIGNNYVYGSERSFTTNSVTTKAALIAQEGLSATFSCTTNLCEFDLQNGSNEYGLVWSTFADVDYDNAEGRQSASEVENESYTICVNKLNYSTKYYYRAYTRTGRKYTYSNVESFTTDEGSTTQGIGNGHTYVNLGLPSGTLWATTNVGAENPEDYGDYFAWGEVEPKSTYAYSKYKYCKGSYNTMIKYCSNSQYGTVDNKTELDLEDDVAYMNWGEGWRMPSNAQLTELRENCTWTWDSTKKGYAVVGPNKSSIFLPAAGYYFGSSLSDAGSHGYYWSRSLDERCSYLAYLVHFLSDGVYRNTSYRYRGLPVRPVRQN